MTDERNASRERGALRDVIIVAARRYRDTMRRYLAAQAAAMERGASLDDLVTQNQAGFQDAVRAEEELFALLDRLEAMEAHAAGAVHDTHTRT